MSNPTELPDLLPCPFCGNGSVHVQDSYLHGQGFMVMCGNCTGEGPLCETEQNATEQWNRRAQPEDEAPQAVYQFRARNRQADWIECDAGIYARMKAAETAHLFEYRTLYTAPAAQHAESGAPSHETIVREGGDLVCTACGTSAPGTPEAPADQDAARYQWLKERFTGYDFYWGGDPMAEREEDKGKCVIVFECGQDFRAGRDFEPAIDAAIQRAAQLDGGQEGSESNG